MLLFFAAVSPDVMKKEGTQLGEALLEDAGGAAAGGEHGASTASAH